MNNNTVVIIENGEQLDCSFEESDRLVDAGIIYRCPECGDDVAHISEKSSMDEAVGFLKGIGVFK